MLNPSPLTYSKIIVYHIESCDSDVAKFEKVKMLNYRILSILLGSKESVNTDVISGVTQTLPYLRRHQTACRVFRPVVLPFFISLMALNLVSSPD